MGNQIRSNGSRRGVLRGGAEPDHCFGRIQRSQPVKIFADVGPAYGREWAVFGELQSGGLRSVGEEQGHRASWWLETGSPVEFGCFGPEFGSVAWFECAAVRG